jgi:uncharacterized protein (TIGR03437 family)
LIVASGPAIVANPPSLSVNVGALGGQVPGGGGGPTRPAISQIINVASTAGASPFSVAISDSTCGDFLSATPVSGATPAVVAITTNPANVTGTCTARITVSSPGLAAATVPVTLTLQAGPGGFRPQAPAITAIANSASYATGPVAPGTLVTIFGTNLGGRNMVSGTFADGQLSTSVGGVQVRFDGTPAPILYARFDQIGVAVPFEVAGKTQVAVQVTTATGQPIAPVQLPVSPVSPAIYTRASTGSGQASIYNQSGLLNSATEAAPKGSTVSIYVTGAGQMTPVGRTGALGSGDQTIAAPVTVSIGGQNARVAYAGSVLGSLQGLYQINAVVPDGVTAGSVPIQVTVGGTSSQTGVTMYVQ